MRRPTWTYFATAGVMLLLLLWKLTHRRGDDWSWSDRGEQTSADAGSNFVPAQVYGEEGLQVGATVTAIPGERRIVLRLEDGEVTLTLFDPRASTDPEVPMAFGKARLEAKDAKNGGAFVAAFARFIGAPERRPRVDPSPLVPLELEYVQLAKAENGRPETTKLFLHGKRREAEVFFDLWPDGVRAAFLEKDEVYRRDLVAILAETLRDGPPPRRTVETDPHLATTAPLFASTSLLHGGKELSDLTFVDDVLTATAEETGHAKILRWKDLALPPDTLESLQGEVLVTSAAPKGGQLAIVLGGDRGDAGQSKSLLVVDVHSGALVPLVTDENLAGQRQPPVWSPDGKKIAIASVFLGQKEPTLVRVIDVKQKAIVASTKDGGVPARWTTSGLLLHADDDSVDSPARTFVWFPGTGEPTPFDAPKSWQSPDGRFTVSLSKSGVFVAGGLSFEPSRDADRDAVSDMLDDAIDAGPTWIGPHDLLLASDELLSLDVETMKLRYLTGASFDRFVAASLDGKRAVVGDADAIYYARP
ncbi:MAG: hypothetical protein ABI175_05120 [Polyangiales bacterium]